VLDNRMIDSLKHSSWAMGNLFAQNPSTDPSNLRYWSTPRIRNRSHYKHKKIKALGAWENTMWLPRRHQPAGHWLHAASSLTH